ncbi:helix-turn-helix transcriptional regulator [Pelistega europaea]|uniref:Helix-turn-helix domain-containing protein n=1 Tax=Pelistega europaea TaxID=106147 RepID=A0A7Y4LBJ9_9BURK|nr:helix-turn-helix domain-containing protein [Pelistega europaea]NOL50545.1 helix-turn-helix domain-containing protein [Pelistega europaea]
MTIHHPGLRIKEKVIPKELSVSDAAKLLGVARPTLSKLLNGRASLSVGMAQLLANTFSFSLDELLRWQSEYEGYKVSVNRKLSVSHVYAPPFLSIKANTITKWVSEESIEARSRFAVFLRTLIHSTVSNISCIDFPGNDDAERPGWDGWLEANEVTPWVPEGKSGWEWGVTNNIRRKAHDDFTKSLKVAGQDAAEITFVFVTPRRWVNKNKWAAQKKALKKWKDVRVYDASNLEQWLEQSLPAQTWLANEIGLDNKGVRSLERCWFDWSNRCNPALVPDFFDDYIKNYRKKIFTYLSNPPSETFHIYADTTDEGIAFLSRVLCTNQTFYDQCLVFDSLDVFPSLMTGAGKLVAITDKPDIGNEFSPYRSKIHTFIVSHKALTNQQNPNAITLEVLNKTTFVHALEKMGKSFDEAGKLANQVGFSLSVLGRQLNNHESCKKPLWVKEYKQDLIPFLFAGAWDSSNEEDKRILEVLGYKKFYDEMDRVLFCCSEMDDPPVWVIGQYRGVVSKIDLLFIITPFVTRADLDNYFKVVVDVLGEDDPALDLPQDQQFYANALGKGRKYSRSLRQSIGDTLMLLAVHGNLLFKERLGYDCQCKVDEVVESLLTPVTSRKLLSCHDIFSVLAESSPDVFLNVVSSDLKNEGEIFSVLRPVSNVTLESPKYTDLLVALEKLAWDKAYVSRVVDILTQLSSKDINDKYVNKPLHSLGKIFFPFYPQTSLNIDERILLITQLIKKHPVVGLNLCIDLIPEHLPKRVSIFPSHQYVWKNTQAAPMVTTGDVHHFYKEMIKLVLTPELSYSIQQLTRLISRSRLLTDEQQDQLWGLVKQWFNNGGTDEQKKMIRSAIHGMFLSRWAKKREPTAALTPLGQEIYNTLKSNDEKGYEWLFKSIWIHQESHESVADLEYEDREEVVEKKRIEVLSTLFESRQMREILRLCEIGDCAYLIGALMSEYVLNETQWKETIFFILQETNDSDSEGKFANLLRGLLCINNLTMARVKQLIHQLSEKDRLRVCLLAPFRAYIWELVECEDEEYQRGYWQNVGISVARQEEIDEIPAGVQHLLNAHRPLAAFSYIALLKSKVNTEMLYSILADMANSSELSEGSLPGVHDIVESFELIQNCQSLSLEQKASLEFLYVGVLAPHGLCKTRLYGLEKYIEECPEFFVQLISWLFKREDGLDDAENLSFEKRKMLADKSHEVLNALRRIPGTDECGIIQENALRKWIEKTRVMGNEKKRIYATEYYIGELLSHGPTGEDGVWPCEVIRDVVEDLEVMPMINGMYIGKANSESAVEWVGDGYEKEEENIKQYKRWGEKLVLTHPFVAQLLKRLARGKESMIEYLEKNRRLRVRGYW